MNRIQFFDILRSKLSKNLGEDEINKIMEFYSLRLSNGLANGKSEEELLAEFGNPNHIVHTLQPKKLYPKDSFIYLTLFLIGLFPIFNHLLQPITTYAYSTAYIFFIYMYAAVSPILVCLLPHFIKNKLYVIPTKKKNLCLIYQVVTIIAIILILAISCNQVIYTVLDLEEKTILDYICKFILYDLLHGQMDRVAPFINSLLFLPILTLVVLWFITLFYEKDSFNVLSIGTFFSSGLLGTTALFRSLMYSLNNIDSFMILFSRCWIPLAISLVSGILFFLGSYILPKINTKFHFPILSIQ